MPAKQTPEDNLLAYLQLVRIPNVFTAISDVAMGFVVANHSMLPAGPFFAIVLATSLLYCGGMVLNDVFDIEVDRQERPQRPLPSGKIDLDHARKLGYGMLAGGVALAWIAGFVTGGQAPMGWRSGAIAIVLAGVIVAYNATLKKTALGPIAMGLCRFLNLLMAMGLAQTIREQDSGTLGFTPFQLIVAGSIGIYIVGITIYSRQEVETGRRGPLFLGFVLVVAGLAGLAMSGDWAQFEWPVVKREVRILLIIAIGFSIVRRCLLAIQQPTPDVIQPAIKHALISLIILDAAMVAIVAGAAWAAAVLALLLPATFLGKKIYST